VYVRDIQCRAVVVDVGYLNTNFQESFSLSIHILHALKPLPQSDLGTLGDNKVFTQIHFIAKIEAFDWSHSLVEKQKMDDTLKLLCCAFMLDL